MYSIGEFELRHPGSIADQEDTPYDTVKAGQDWWKSVDLPDKDKDVLARSNAIKLFKLPLEL